MREAVIYDVFTGLVKEPEVVIDSPEPAAGDHKREKQKNDLEPDRKLVFYYLRFFHYLFSAGVTVKLYHANSEAKIV